MPNDIGLNFQLDNADSSNKAMSLLEAVLKRIDKAMGSTGAALDAFDANLARVAKNAPAAANGIAKVVDNLERMDRSLNGLSAKMAKLTDQLVQGFEKGLSTRMTKVATSAANDVLTAFKKTWGIASPSRVMAAFGGNLADGLERGLNLAVIGTKAATEFITAFTRTTVSLFASLGTTLIQGASNVAQQIGERMKTAGAALRAQGLAQIQSGIQDITTGGFASLLNSRFIGQASDFDAVLNQIRVFGKLSKDVLGDVQKQLLNFAAVSIFDPQQTASAFLTLQKAGLSVKDAMDLLPKSIDLATASNQNLDTATLTLIRTMQGVGAPFSEATRVIDALVGGADISTAEVKDFADSFAFAASSIKNLKIPIEDAVTAFAVLSDQFIVGERAGTGVRALLDSLIDPTTEAKKALQALNIQVKDGKGNFVGMGPLLDQFATAIDKLRKKGVGEGAIVELLSKLGDRNTSSAILALTSRTEDGTLAFRKYGAELKTANSAQAIAAEMMKTFAGTMESLKGSVQTLIITAFLPLMQKVIQPFLEQLIIVVNTMSSLPQPILDVGAAVATIVPAFITFSGVLKLINGILAVFGGVTLTQLGAAMSGIVATLLDPVGLVAGFAGLAATLVPLVPLVALLIAGAFGLYKVFEQVRDAFANNFGGAGDALTSFLNSVGSLFSTIGGLFKEGIALISSFASEFNDTFGRALNVDTSGIVNLLKSVTAWIENIRNGLEEVRQVMAFINMVRGVDTSGGNSGDTNAALKEREQVQARLNVLEMSDADIAAEKTNLLRKQAEIEAQLATGGDTTSGQGAAKTNALLTEREQIMARLAALNGDYSKTLNQGVMGQQSVVVKSGDTLWSLARKYGTTVDELKKLNNITDPRKLRTGQALKIPIKLQDEKGALKKQLDDLNKKIPPGARLKIPGEIDETMLSDQFKKIANSPVFKAIFGDAFDVTSAVAKIDDFEKSLRNLAVSFVKLDFGTLDLTGFKNAIQTGIDNLSKGTKLDLSGIGKWIQASIPDKIDLDFSKLRASFTAAIQGIFGGGTGANTLDMQHATAAGFKGGVGGSIQSVILNSIQNIDLSGVQKIFETHFDSIMNFLTAAAAFVIGGPVGLAIGVGKLVISAIQNDFLGVTTKLKESGLYDAAVNLFNSVKTALESAFNAVFNGGDTGSDALGKQYAKAAGYDVDAIRKNALGPIGQILEDLKGLPANLGNTFKVVGEGIAGFIENLKGVDASGIPRLLEVIAAFFGGIGTLVVRGIGRALPDLGEALKNFIEAFSNLGKGDIGGVATSLLKVVGDLIGAVVNFSKPAANAVIEFIEKLTGWKLPDADMAIAIALGAINQAFIDLQTTVENVGRSIEDFFRDVKVGILQVQSIGQTGKALDDINAQIAAIQGEIKARNIGSEITDTINEQLAAGGGINLGAFLKLDASPAAIAAQMSTAQRAKLLEGVKKAFEEGDQQALDVLLPIAAQPTFDSKQTTKAVQDALDAAIKRGDTKAISAILPFAPQFKLDTTGVPAEIKQQIADAADDASNMGTVQTPENTPDANAIKVPITITPDIKLELDPEKFDANIGDELGKLFKAGKSREDIIAGIQSYSGLDKATATTLVDKFLEGIQDSIIAKADEAGRGVEYRAKIASALAQGIFNIDTLKGDDFNLGAQTLTDAIEGGIGKAIDAVDLTKLQGKTLSPETLNALGLSVVTGISTGISTNTPALTATTTTMVDDGIKTPIQDGLNIHSPSGWGIDMGYSVLEGIGIGISTALPLVQVPLNIVLQAFTDIENYANLAGAAVISAAFSMGITALPFMIVATINTNLLANAWYLVADNAAKAEAAIKKAIAAGAGGYGGPSGGGGTGGGNPPGMAHGGAVVPGQLYEVAEPDQLAGAPELLYSNGRTFMIPSAAGMVMPPVALPSGGGMSGPTNNNNYGSSYNITVNAGDGADVGAIRNAVKQALDDHERNNGFNRRATLRGTT